MNLYRKLHISFLLVLLPYLLKSQDSLLAVCTHPDSLRNIVAVLASDSLEGRYTGSPGNEKAALFISNEFKKAGLHPLAGFNGYFMPLGGLGSNVIGAIQGKSSPGQLVIFSAHYDHIGTHANTSPRYSVGSAKVEKGDHIFNGANDDASGVAAVIALGRYFAKQEQPERTILFIAFTGEELGLKGSAVAATIFQPDSIVADINIEMIGRPYLANNKPYMTGHAYPELLKLMNKRLYLYNEKKYRRSYIQYDPFPDQNLFERSDNYSFAGKGVPAHSVMVSSPLDEFYHNENDEAGTLDYNLMSEVIKAIAVGASGLLNGTDSPKRLR